MKYCLSSDQESSYLKKAQEIKFKYNQRKIIPRYAERYSEADIILQHTSTDKEIDWDEIKFLNTKIANRLILCLDSISSIQKAKEIEGLKYYWGYHISSYWELNSVISLGVCYVRLAAPLFFELDKVKRFNIPIRVVPNLAIQDNLPHSAEDTIHGLWIRPEDIEAYSDYISTIEFECNDNKPQERALYRIYAEDKNWPGELNLIIQDIQSDAVNRMIKPEVSQHRINCGQKCMRRWHCTICDNMLKLANPERIKEYAEKINKN